jgi:hypothetical protein
MCHNVAGPKCSNGLWTGHGTSYYCQGSTNVYAAGRTLLDCVCCWHKMLLEKKVLEAEGMRM